MQPANGWTYSEFTGSDGGWEFDSQDGYIRIACTTLGGRIWQAFVVRQTNGETMHYSEHSTRAAAMAAAERYENLKCTP